MNIKQFFCWHYWRYNIGYRKLKFGKAAIIKRKCFFCEKKQWTYNNLVQMWQNDES